MCSTPRPLSNLPGSPFRLDDQASARRELERLRDVRDRCRAHRQELHDQRTRLLGASNAAKTVQACVQHAAAAADTVGDDRDGSRAAPLLMDDVVRYFASWLPADESAALQAGGATDSEQHYSSRASSSHSGHTPMVGQRARGSSSSTTARSRTMGAIDEDSTAAETHSSAPPSPPSSSTRRTFHSGGGGLSMLSFAAQRALASPSAYLSSSASSAASSVCASPFAMPSTPRALPASLLRSALGAADLFSGSAMPEAALSPPPPPQPRALRASPPRAQVSSRPSLPVGADVDADASIQSAPVVSQSFAIETESGLPPAGLAASLTASSLIASGSLVAVVAVPADDVAVAHSPRHASLPPTLPVAKIDSPTDRAPSSSDGEAPTGSGCKIVDKEADPNQDAADSKTTLEAAAEAALDGAALELDELDLL